MRVTTLLVIATALLAACETVVSSGCPSLYKYSAEEQQKAADEIALLPGDSVLLRMMGDYAAVRNQIRVCKGEKPNL